MKVSVLLTTYNRPEMLKKAVESVLNQSFTDYELIILDDNSDNILQRAYLAACTDLENIRVIRSTVSPEDRKKTTRYATMVNIGLKEAQGEYIAYLCDDDYFEPTKLELMVKYLDEHPEVSVVYGKQRIVQLVNGQEVPYAGIFREATEVKTNASCQVDHSSVMMRRNLVEKVGYWDDDPGWWGSADGVYWDKLNQAGFYFYPIDVVTDTHVYHDGSWTKDGRWEKELGI